MDVERSPSELIPKERKSILGEPRLDLRSFGISSERGQNFTEGGSKGTSLSKMDESGVCSTFILNSKVILSDEQLLKNECPSQEKTYWSCDFYWFE